MPIRAYALCILVGILVAAWLSARRWKARGGDPAALETVLLWAIPFGIVGARIYYVLIEWDRFFGPGADPLRALYIWEGGLGIYGAVAFGALGAWIACRRNGISFWAMADTIAPGLVIAQAVGRLGNYFNQELFGRPTDLPWGLLIDPQHRPAGYAEYATFHPTFLYEMIWNLTVAAVLILADRKFRLGHGKVFALYLVLYSLGRSVIETVRIDTVNEIGGIRINNYPAAFALVVGLVWLIWLIRNRPGREENVQPGRPDRDSADTDDPVRERG